MSSRDFSISIHVPQPPATVFRAVNDPRSWWSAEIEGTPEALDGRWTYHFEDSHRSALRTVELIPDRRIAWLVEDNYFAWTKDKTEWTGNKITFDITDRGFETELVFTHIGLVPTYECYEACSSAWTGFVEKSLRSLIGTGIGQPKWYEQP